MCAFIFLLFHFNIQAMDPLLVKNQVDQNDHRCSQDDNDHRVFTFLYLPIH